MAHYQADGQHPAEAAHPAPAAGRPGHGSGELYYEELMGEEGFSSDSSLLYHRNIPSTIADAREWTVGDLSTTPNHPLLPRHLKLHDLFDAKDVKDTDVVTGRRLVLGNGDVRISYAVAGAPSPWYRNGIGDECVYVERGRARVETVFGAFEVGEGDYVIIPRATTHRWIPKRSTKDPLRAYCIEANSHIAPPKRYLSASTASCSSTPPTASATCACRDGPAARRGRRRAGRTTRPRSTSSTAATGRGGDRRHGPHAALPPARRRRLGRLPLPLRVQRARLRADHRPRPPAAAGAPGLRGLELRRSATSCRARSTTTRCRSRCPTTTPTSTATRSCSTSTATTRPARARASARARSRCTPAATPTARSPGADRGLDRRRVLRRARRHGRHLPPARARRGRARRRRRQVRLVLERGPAHRLRRRRLLHRLIRTLIIRRLHIG